jgi:hypothetical protein
MNNNDDSYVVVLFYFYGYYCWEMGWIHNNAWGKENESCGVSMDSIAVVIE